MSNLTRFRVCAVCFFGMSISLQSIHGETLREICDRLEKLETNRVFRKGVDQCRESGDSNSATFALEPDALVKERYLADCANLFYLYSERQADPKNKKSLAIEALNAWIDYFSWFNGLSDKDQDRLVSNYPQKLSAAASGLGIAALAATDPKSIQSAWIQYEQLKDVFFAPKALDMWLAALLHPNYPVPVNDQIFFRTADDPELLKQLSEKDRIEHSQKFADRLKKFSADDAAALNGLSEKDRIQLTALLKNLSGAKQGMKVFLEKFNGAFPGKQPAEEKK